MLLKYLRRQVHITIFNVLIALFILGCSKDSSNRNSPERAVQIAMVDLFNNEKQTIFDALHPIGKATGIKVHSVDVNWKTLSPQSWRDVNQIEVRATLYWDGPIQKNGYTKFRTVYDNESEVWLGSEIIATNGVTNDEAIIMTTLFLKDMIED